MFNLPAERCWHEVQISWMNFFGGKFCHLRDNLSVPALSLVQLLCRLPVTIGLARCWLLRHQCKRQMGYLSHKPVNANS